MEQQVAELEALVRGVEDELGRVCSKQRSKLEALERAWRERQHDASPPAACIAASVALAHATPAKSAPVDPHGHAAVQIVPRPHGERAEEHSDGEQPATHAHLVETIYALRAELEARDCQERRQNGAYVRRIAQMDMEKEGEECVQHLQGEIDRLLFKVMCSSVSSASTLPSEWLRACGRVRAHTHKQRRLGILCMLVHCSSLSLCARTHCMAWGSSCMAPRMLVNYCQGGGDQHQRPLRCHLLT